MLKGGGADKHRSRDFCYDLCRRVLQALDGGLQRAQSGCLFGGRALFLGRGFGHLITSAWVFGLTLRYIFPLFLPLCFWNRRHALFHFPHQFLTAVYLECACFAIKLPFFISGKNDINLVIQAGAGQNIAEHSHDPVGFGRTHADISARGACPRFAGKWRVNLLEQLLDFTDDSRVASYHQAIGG